MRCRKKVHDALSVRTYETQIAASDGEYPLLGTMLLDGHHLDINYTVKTVELT
jgi:hypothetical protein